MPLSEIQLNALKREMRTAAAAGYRFSDEIAASLQGEIELTSEQIRKWVAYIHARYTTPAEKEEFLSGTKVCFKNTKRCLNAPADFIARWKYTWQESQRVWFCVV